MPRRKKAPHPSPLPRGGEGRVRGALQARLQRVQMLAMDVDGVLTDAGMYYTESGDELKKFHVRDGMGIKLLQAAGLVTAFITREKTTIVERRGQKLAGPEGHPRGDDKLAGPTPPPSQKGPPPHQVALTWGDINDPPDPPAL